MDGQYLPQYVRRAGFIYKGVDLASGPDGHYALPPDAGMSDFTGDWTAEAILAFIRRRRDFHVAPGHDFSDERHPANAAIDAGLSALETAAQIAARGR